MVGISPDFSEAEGEGTKIAGCLVIFMSGISLLLA